MKVEICADSNVAKHLGHLKPKPNVRKPCLKKNGNVHFNAACRATIPLGFLGSSTKNLALALSVELAKTIAYLVQSILFFT